MAGSNLKKLSLASPSSRQANVRPAETNWCLFCLSWSLLRKEAVNFLTELMDSPLNFRSLGWVKSSWIGRSSEQSFLESSWPWGLPCSALSNPTLYLQSCHLDFISTRLTWVSLSPIQVSVCTPLIGSAVILIRTMFPP